jgi:hypothetical protein
MPATRDAKATGWTRTKELTGRNSLALREDFLFVAAPEEAAHRLAPRGKTA